MFTGSHLQLAMTLNRCQQSCRVTWRCKYIAIKSFCVNGVKFHCSLLDLFRKVNCHRNHDWQCQVSLPYFRCQYGYYQFPNVLLLLTRTCGAKLKHDGFELWLRKKWNLQYFQPGRLPCQMPFYFRNWYLQHNAIVIKQNDELSLYSTWSLNLFCWKITIVSQSYLLDIWLSFTVNARYITELVFKFVWYHISVLNWW